MALTAAHFHRSDPLRRPNTMGNIRLIIPCVYGVENECACDKMQQPQFLAPCVKYIYIYIFFFKNCVTRSYDAMKRQISVLELVLDFKLSPCFVSFMYSFGYFPGVRLWFADVSEPSISSIFKGWM